MILLKGRRRRKAKVTIRAKLILRTSATTEKNMVVGSEIVQGKQRMTLLLLLFRMTLHWKEI